MELLDTVIQWLTNLPIFSDPKWLIAIFGIGVWFVYEKFFKGKKAYCMVRIKEKRGDTFFDHGKIYKAHLHKMTSETGRIIRWLYIDGINKVWRVPKNTELTPSQNGKILELAWFGKNTFQVLKLDEFMFEKSDGKWTRKKTTELSLRVVPEDLKYMDYELSTKIDNLTSNKSWLQNWLDKHGAIFIVMLFCFLMVFVAVNKLSDDLANTRDSFESVGQKIAGFIENPTQMIDENTIKGQDLSKVGSSNPNGGGDK